MPDGVDDVGFLLLPFVGDDAASLSVVDAAPSDVLSAAASSFALVGETLILQPETRIISRIEAPPAPMIAPTVQAGTQT